MTKKNEGLLWNYEHARYTDIYEAYAKPSYRKVCAFKNCLADMEWKKGYSCRIPSASCHFFTFAFKYRDEAGKERLRYHTHANTYDFALE